MGIIQRQAIKNLFTNYTGIAIGFVNLIVIMPRFLTPEEVGLTRILYSFSMLVAMFVPLGIGNATTKYFPQFRDRDKKHHGYFGFMLLFPVAGYLIAALALWTMRGFITDQYRAESALFTEFFNYVFPLTFFLSFLTVLNIYCYSLFKTTVPSFINDVIIRLLVIGVISVYYLKWITLNQFILCYVIIYGIQLVFLLIYIWYEEPPSFKIDWNAFKTKGVEKIFRYSLILWLAAVASQGLKELGTIMLGKYMALEFVAVYAIAAFIPVIIEAPLGALEKIASFKISDAWKHNDKEQIQTIYRKSVLYMALLGGILFLLVNANIDNLLKLMPEKYQAGNYVVNIISLGTLINMVTGLNTAILFSSDKYHYGAGLLIMLVVMSFLLQFIFIPMYEIEGAALATALSSVLYNSISFFVVWKHFRLQPFDRKTLAVFFIIALCIITNYFIPQQTNFIADIIIRSLIIVIVYGASIFFMKIIPDYRELLKIKKE
jgi:O-antigen/teichoic acid export membrane protein